MILYNIDYCDLDDYYAHTMTLATFETESERDRAYEWLIQWLYEQYITTKERQTALEENWEYEQASLGAWNRHNHIVQIIRHYRIQLKALSKSTTETSTLEEFKETASNNFLCPWGTEEETEKLVYQRLRR